MAKRYIDTDLFKKPIFRKAPLEYKLFWIYILTDCNHAGIWLVDIEVANIRIGADIDKNKALEIFKNKIISFDNGDKWFLPTFIEFQYGELNANNRVHKSVLDILYKNNIDPYKTLARPLQKTQRVIEDVKDKDKEKDMDKDKYKDQEKDKDSKHIKKELDRVFNGKDKFFDDIVKEYS